MRRIELYFPGEPGSATDWSTRVRMTAPKRLPKTFRPYDCPVALTVNFSFALPPSCAHGRRLIQERGVEFWKETRPVLTDQLLKDLGRALTGIVWTRKTRVCRIAAAKTYGAKPGITVIVEPLEAMILPGGKTNESAFF